MMMDRGTLRELDDASRELFRCRYNDLSFGNKTRVRRYVFRQDRPLFGNSKSSRGGRN
jgi:hypothetical protein